MTDTRSDGMLASAGSTAVLRRGWPLLLALALLVPAWKLVSSYRAPAPPLAPAFDPAAARTGSQGPVQFRDQRPLIAAPATPRPNFELPETSDARSAAPATPPEAAVPPSDRAPLTTDPSSSSMPTPAVPPVEAAPVSTVTEERATEPAAAQPSSASLTRDTTLGPAPPSPAMAAPATAPIEVVAASRPPPPVLAPPAPAPAVATAAPSPATAPAPSAELAGMLLQRGQALLKQGDIAGARMFLRRAAEVGSAEGALLLGSTFDASWLATRNALGIAADKEQARRWYREAGKLGSKEAADRLGRIGS